MTCLEHVPRPGTYGKRRRFGSITVRKDTKVHTTRRRLLTVSAAGAGLALLNRQTNTLTPVSVAAATDDNNLQPLVQRVVDLKAVEVSFYIEIGGPGEFATFILKRPSTTIGSPYVFQNLGKIDPEDKEDVIKWVGGEADEWTLLREELGIAWKFTAKNQQQPTRLRVPFGGLEFDPNGPATAWSWVNCTVATWRAKNPSTTRLVQHQPTAQVSCQQPIALAQEKGWTVISWQDQEHGGLRVKLNSAGELPAKWMAAGPRNIDENDTNRSMAAGEWVIYPPFACRAPLGYK